MADHKFSPDKIQDLDDPSRLALMPADILISRCPLYPGQIMADLGCGAGYWTFSYLNQSPVDTFYVCVDIEKRMLEAVERKAKEFGFTQRIQTVLSLENQIPLPEQSIDLAVMGHLYHELKDRKSFLKEVKRILKPLGRIAILDWAVLRPDEVPLRGPPNHIRVSQEIAYQELNELSFSDIQFVEGFIQQWCLIAVQQ